jgi:hypothetical protein
MDRTVTKGFDVLHQFMSFLDGGQLDMSSCHSFYSPNGLFLDFGDKASVNGFFGLEGLFEVHAIQRTTITNLAVSNEAEQNLLLDPLLRPPTNGSTVMTALPLCK